MLNEKINFAPLQILFWFLFANSISHAVIYEHDDRVDLNAFNPTSREHTLSSAVFLVMNRAQLIKVGNGNFLLDTVKYQDAELKIEEPLCKEERFQDQPVLRVRAATGFLINSGFGIGSSIGH